mgnify:FL=1
MESGPMQAWRSELFVTDLVKMEKFRGWKKAVGIAGFDFGG